MRCLHRAGGIGAVLACMVLAGRLPAQGTSATSPGGRRAPCARPNRLIDASSGYLRDHACEPVDWQPWSDGAFAQASEERKPVFVSIGYASCHWCRVMESESFSDPEVARQINEAFVPVLVDREERPDVDALYQHAAEMLGTGGGWPLNLFLTPGKRPFFAVSYLPPNDEEGQPGLRTLVRRVAALWNQRAEQLETSAGNVIQALQEAAPLAAGEPDSARIRSRAFDALTGRFDPAAGGFLPAPKFPLAPRLLTLLTHAKLSGDPQALRIVETTLDAIRCGGIYDQLGSGVHRYTTDRRWRQPHFEKMLYDQALLATVSMEAWQLSGESRFRRMAEELLDYVKRVLMAPEGSFRAAESADSEGREGVFYLWDEREIRGLLGADADRFFAAFQLVDPDSAEATAGPGVLVRRTIDRPRCLRPRSGASLEAWRRRLLRGAREASSSRSRSHHPHRLERPSDRGLCQSGMDLQ